MPRIIELRKPVGPTTIHDVMQRVGQAEFDRALSYLVTWSYQGLYYPAKDDSYVEITVCHDNEITALYKGRKEDTTGMLMVAVWRHNEQHYTFHT